MTYITEGYISESNLVYCPAFLFEIACRSLIGWLTGIWPVERSFAYSTNFIGNTCSFRDLKKFKM